MDAPTSDDAVPSELECNAAVMSRRGRFSRLRIRLGFGGRKSSSLRRLCAAISRLGVEVAEADPNETVAARQYLVQARAAAEQFDTGSGWAAFQAARRVMLRGTDADRIVRAASVRAEADKKLSGWRSEAVSDLLRDPKGSPPTWEAIRQAQFQIDESSSNLYRRLDLFASRIGYVVVILVVLLALSVAVVESGSLPYLEGTSLDSLGSLLGIMLLGAIGSILSVALTRVRGSGRPVPQLIESNFVDVLRPVLGAASAVVLVLVLEAGLQTTIDTSGSKVYVWAIVAGFSERLLRRTLESVAQLAEGQGKPPA